MSAPCLDLPERELLRLAQALTTPGHHRLPLAFLAEEELLGFGPGLWDWLATEVHTGPQEVTVACLGSRVTLTREEAEDLALRLLLRALGGGDHADLPS